MPSRKHIPIILLAGIGLGLCVANVAIALQRTAIPRELEGAVSDLRILREKHPGVDDVLMLTIDDGPAIQIEYDLYDRLAIGDRVEKDAWSAGVRINDDSFAIPWSIDLRGMAIVMPILAVGTVVLTWLSMRRTS